MSAGDIPAVVNHQDDELWVGPGLLPLLHIFFYSLLLIVPAFLKLGNDELRRRAFITHIARICACAHHGR